MANIWQQQPLAAALDLTDYTAKVKNYILEHFEDLPLAYVHSFGCQQNTADTEKIKGLLAQMGYGFTTQLENASLVLYNTCAVRENAEKRVFGTLGALKPYKRQNPKMVVCVCGCMVEQEHVVAKIKKSYQLVDIVFGTHAIKRLPKMLYEHFTHQYHVIDLLDDQQGIAEGLPILREDTIKASVPIMNGCDNFCSYCIVPYVRGREKSRKSEDIVAECRQLIKQGYKEILLLGQNVNSYGKGLEENINFARLLQKVNAIEGDFRIRFMTSHPKDCTYELLDTIAACEKVCNHIHLPVQCGSDRVLKEMNRHYTAGQYLELVRYAKEHIPNVTFTSDIIVGFPGETYEDFLKTIALIKEVRYHLLYTFLYSKRMGTRAALMPDPVEAAEKSRWFNELLQVQDAIGLEINQSYVGKTLRVLIDGPGRTAEGTLCGRCESNIIVECKGSAAYIGQFVDVKITQAFKWALVGDMII